MNISTAVATKEEAATSKKHWTQAEFHQLPEGPPYYELEDGELIEIPRPRLRHQEIVGHVYEYKNTPEGYLLTEILAPPEIFSPQLFPGLTINLAELMGELIAEEDQHE